MEVEAQEVFKRLSYNAETGDFVWIFPGHGIRVGQIAGYPHASGHIMITVCKKKCYAHRLAFLFMTGDWPDGDVDHINQVPGDNRWVNLRVADRAENNFNSKKVWSSNSSGFKGVHWSKGAWQVHIGYNGTSLYLGRYNDLHEAIGVRKEAEDRIRYGS